jgi:antitoxin YefM
MEAITYSWARSHFAQTIDNVCDNHQAMIITKKNDKSAVLLSLADYQALEETAYLLRSPQNAKRLMDSIVELEAGQGFEKELLECD